MKLAKKTLFWTVVVLGLVATLAFSFEISRIFAPEEEGLLFLIERIMNSLILPGFVYMCVHISIFLFNKKRRIPPSVYLLFGILFFVGALAMLFTTTTGIFYKAFATLSASFFALPAGFMCITMFDKTRLKV